MFLPFYLEGRVLKTWWRKSVCFSIRQQKEQKTSLENILQVNPSGVVQSAQETGAKQQINTTILDFLNKIFASHDGRLQNVVLKMLVPGRRYGSCLIWLVDPEGLELAMSEKYMSIGAPMTELPVAQSRSHTSLSHR